MAVKGSLSGRLEKQILQMEVGEEGYTLPWAVSFHPVDLGYDVFLYLKYPAYPAPQGTVQLYIKRIGPRKNDFEVDLESVRDYKWGLEKVCYVGADESDIIKIGRVDGF